LRRKLLPFRQQRLRLFRVEITKQERVFVLAGYRNGADPIADTEALGGPDDNSGATFCGFRNGAEHRFALCVLALDTSASAPDADGDDA
jgi:hypothetical protein